jgi:sigma-54 dependent transcriptional regulator, flagellar regulatory protein
MKTGVLLKENCTATDDLIIGKSSAIVALKEMIGRVARSSASVMITGPSGAGKEVVAQAIHAESARSNKPFVALNCGAIPAELIESELFGHERGSFTGANARRIGRFEEASSGTLFLDEIGDMRFDMQVKLLRVLEDGIVSRIGGSAPIPVDVRIISATHQDMDDAITQNRFREDLYFRLGVVPVRVPDLASRVEDIPLLIQHFQKKSPATARARFDNSALARLMTHNWPGNVRELRNVVERAGVLFGGQSVDARDVDQLLGLKISQVLAFNRNPDVEVAAPAAAPFPKADPLTTAADPKMPIDLKALLETMELERIQFALDLADGVISDAARLLTLKRTTLIEKMRKYGVDRTC